MQKESVEAYLEEGCLRCSKGGPPECKVHTWQGELRALRGIALSCGLTEEVKWGNPCYTWNGANLAMVGAFNDYAFIAFFKGALLKDAEKILESPGQNSQASRQLRFTEVKKVNELEATIKAYIYEAIEVERSGLSVDFKAKNELEYPEELLQKFEEDPELKEGFEALTPGSGNERDRKGQIHG